MFRFWQHAKKSAVGRALGDFSPLSKAEEKLREAVRRGEMCVVGLEVPEEPTPHNTIRPSFLRFLALGGDVAPIHEKGLQLFGAFIGGERDGYGFEKPLDLEGGVICCDLWLLRCNFYTKIILRGAQGRTIALDGSVFPGFIGDGLSLTGGLFFRKVRTKGETRLIDARIGSNLECDGACFENAEGKALICDGADINGNVLLHDRFHAKGETRWLGSRIGGNLYCTGGCFENEESKALAFDGADIGGTVFLTDQFHALGETRFIDAHISGNLFCYGGRFENRNGVALLCDGADIGGNVFLTDRFHATGETRYIGARISGIVDCEGGRFENIDGTALSCESVKINVRFNFRKTRVEGLISLLYAQAATLSDDLISWPTGMYALDGFCYNHISIEAPLDAESRIAWLDRQIPKHLSGSTFALQPWTHLAKVFREQGHFREAAEVEIAREDRLRRAGLIADLPSPKLWRQRWAQADAQGRYDPAQSTAAQLKRALNLPVWLLHWLYGLLSGYGYRPMRIVYAALVIFLAFAAFYDAAATRGAFVPANPSLVKAMTDDCGKQFAPGKIVWTRCDALLAGYPRFSALAYSFDLILPVVRLGQATSWTPVGKGDWLSFAGLAQMLVWFEEIFGWTAALTLAAIASGLVKRKDRA